MNSDWLLQVNTVCKLLSFLLYYINLAMKQSVIFLASATMFQLLQHQLSFTMTCIFEVLDKYLISEDIFRLCFSEHPTHFLLISLGIDYTWSFFFFYIWPNALHTLAVLNFILVLISLSYFIHSAKKQLNTFFMNAYLNWKKKKKTYL